jgi:two-component system OmpR family response regulator
MLKVLNVHDKPVRAEEITSSFRSSGYSADTTRRGLAAVTRAILHDNVVVVLGETLPDTAAPAVVTALRGVGVQTPVIMVSGSAEIALRIQALRAGADDYRAMPFTQEEMLARVEAILRKMASVPHNSAILRTNALELDLVRRIVSHRQRKQRLRPTECRVLEFMIRHAGRTLTRSEILEAVWKYHYDPETNRLAVHVGRLRKKLAALGLPQMILTIRGSGYRFE